MESGEGLAGIEDLLRQSTALSNRLSEELAKSAVHANSVNYSYADDPTLSQDTYPAKPVEAPRPLNTNFMAMPTPTAGVGMGVGNTASLPMPASSMMPSPLPSAMGTMGMDMGTTGMMSATMDEAQHSFLRHTPQMTTPTPVSKTEGAHLDTDGAMLDPNELQTLSNDVLEEDILHAQSAHTFNSHQHASGGDMALPTNTASGFRGSALPSTTAEEAEILQSKAEAIVAALDDSQVLKQKNPFGGLSFQDLIQKISLDPNLKVYNKSVPAEKLVQGTVAEQLITVVDCEKERYLYKTRMLVEDYENQLSSMKTEHEEDKRKMRDEFNKQRQDTENECDAMLAKNRDNVKGQTEQLAREGLQNQLDSERTKDELALVNEDVSALKKLLFFWKKKNNVLKQQFDDNERELVLAREKLRDYHQIHEMDAYKVHRFCGQLREKEMKSRWRADELQKRLGEQMVELQHLKEGKSYLAGSSGSDAMDHELTRLEIEYATHHPRGPPYTPQSLQELPNFFIKPTPTERCRPTPPPTLCTKKAFTLPRLQRRSALTTPMRMTRFGRT